jgi:hypothetical protein
MPYGEDWLGDPITSNRPMAACLVREDGRGGWEIARVETARAFASQSVQEDGVWKVEMIETEPEIEPGAAKRAARAAVEAHLAAYAPAAEPSQEETIDMGRVAP